MLLGASTVLIGLSALILTADYQQQQLEHQQVEQEQLEPILAPLLLVPCLVLSIIHWVGFELYRNN